MSRTTFLQKLGVLIETTTSSYLLLLGIGILLALGVILFTSNRKTKKRNKIVYIVYSLIICLFLLLNHHQALNKVFDYLMENLFLVFLFPNYAFYFLEIVITNIIIWLSLFHYKTSDAIKRLNIIVYLLMNYLLMLLLSVVDSNKLDIFSITSIYSDEKATALMELSSSIFVTWIIFLLLYKGILIYIRKDYKEPGKKIQIVKEIKKLPPNFKATKIPNYVYGNIKKQEDNYKTTKIPDLVYGNIKKQSSNYQITKIPNFVRGSKKKQTSNFKTTNIPNLVHGKINKEPIKKEHLIEKVLDDSFTLEEYKVLRQMLQEKVKGKKQSLEETQYKKINNQIKDLEKNSIAEMKRREQERDIARFTELDRLFRSMK